MGRQAASVPFRTLSKSLTCRAANDQGHREERPQCSRNTEEGYFYVGGQGRPFRRQRFAGCLETALTYRDFPLFSNHGCLAEMASSQMRRPRSKSQACCPCQNRLWPEGTLAQTPGCWSHASEGQSGHHRGRLCKAVHSGPVALQRARPGGEKEGRCHYFNVGLGRCSKFSTVRHTDPRLLMLGEQSSCFSQSLSVTGAL